MYSRIYEIRIQAIRTANDDGSQPATATSNDILNLVNGANTIFNQAGIRFLFDPVTDFETINSTLLNQDFTLLEDISRFTNIEEEPAKNDDIHKEARFKIASLYEDKITIFFRYGSALSYDHGKWKVTAAKLAWSSWNGSNIVYFGNARNPNKFAHEIGHYLEIRHPFYGCLKLPDDFPATATREERKEAILNLAAKKIKRYVEVENHSKDVGLNVFDGDGAWVTDTSPDVRGFIFDELGLDRCTGDLSQIPIHVNFSDNTAWPYYLNNPDRTNIMSYFLDCPGSKKVSPQQIERIRNGLEDGMRHRLISLRARNMNFQLLRKDSDSDTSISLVDAVFIKDGRIATAVRDDSGNLKVIVWDIEANGNVARKGSAETSGQISATHNISACSLGLGLLATSVCDGDGDLKVIIWKISDNGEEVVRKGSASAGKIFASTSKQESNSIASCRLGIEYLATAVRDRQSNLQVIVWHVTADGKIEKADSQETGYVSEVGISSIGGDSVSVATCVRDSEENLAVIRWEWKKTKDGKGCDIPPEYRLVRGRTERAGNVSLISNCTLDKDLMTTSVRDGYGHLSVKAWHFPNNSQDIVPRGDTVVGSVSKVSSCRVGVDLLVTAVKMEDSTLKLILWEIAADGHYVARRGDAKAGAISQVAVCRGGVDLLATAVRDGSGNLKVISWKIT